MSNSKAIKQVINSTKSLKKITSTMKMISMSKFQKASKDILAYQEYRKSLKDFIAIIYSNFSDKEIENIKSPVLRTVLRLDIKKYSRKGKNLDILISTDKGLCGAVNTFVHKRVEKNLKHNHNLQLLSIGRKSNLYINKYHEKNKIDINSIDSSNADYEKVSTIAKEVFKRITSGELKKANVIYNKFYSAVKMELTESHLLPTLTDKEEKHDFIIEGDKEKLLLNALEEYLVANLYYFVLSNRASEHSSRMMAMDGATKNASEKVDTLTLKLNRLRQSKITQEITEIVAGANAV